MKNFKLVLANILFIIHLFLIIFVIQFGFIFVPSKYALVAALFTALVIIHWFFNNYNCIVSDWEAKLRGEERKKTKNVYDSYSAEKITHKVFNNILRLNLTRRQMHYIIMASFTANIILLLVRWKTGVEVINYQKIFGGK